jgi:predicted Zn-ribbon and HTH transcriptional regulator
MNRPPLEVADIIRAAGDGFIGRNEAHLAWPQIKVLRAIRNCRTQALGGHRDRCSKCGYEALSYNSCRNRHCPKCQTNAREQWLAKQTGNLLPVPYLHIVFTLPHDLSALALQNKKVIYDLIFQASAETLLEIGADPKHLGAQIGFLSVLHTWGQNLQHHPHVHCVIPAGGLAPDRSRWIRHSTSFFLPVRVLSRVFRGKFVDGLKRLFRAHKLAFHGSLRSLADPKLFRQFLRQPFRKDWVVYAKRPFGGPAHVLQYLARYTHRVAISNHRLIAFQDGKVSFRWKDYAHGNKNRKMTLSADEFLRRFLLHVLPRGFVRIRHFGFLANRTRLALLTLCRQLLADVPLPHTPTLVHSAPQLWLCPKCSAPMIVTERLTPRDFRLRMLCRNTYADTS